MVTTAARPRRTPAPRAEQPHGRIWRWRRWLFGAALLFFAVIAVGLYMFSHLKLPTPLPLKQTTVIYDFSGGLYPETQAFLAQFFNAQVVTVTASTPAPAAFANNQGFVIDIGHDFGRRWYNCGASAC